MKSEYNRELLDYVLWKYKNVLLNRDKFENICVRHAIKLVYIHIYIDYIDLCYFIFI